MRLCGVDSRESEFVRRAEMIELPVKRPDLVKELGLESVLGQINTVEGQRGGVSSYHERWKLPNGCEVEATDFESSPAVRAERKYKPAGIAALVNSRERGNDPSRTGRDHIKPFGDTPSASRKSYQEIVVYSSEGRILYDSKEQDMTNVPIPR